MTTDAYRAKFDEASEQLEEATRKLERLRAEITSAAQRGMLDAPQARDVAVVTRHISIAITEAEGAKLRAQAAAWTFVNAH